MDEPRTVSQILADVMLETIAHWRQSPIEYADALAEQLMDTLTRIEQECANEAGDYHPARVRAAFAVADACLDGYAQGAKNDGKYLPPDVRRAVREYQAVLSRNNARTTTAPRLLPRLKPTGVSASEVLL
jgi:hypothetical protein